MPKFALVEPNGRVAQVEESIFPIADPFEWVECSDGVDINYVYKDGAFVERDQNESSFE